MAEVETLLDISNLKNTKVLVQVEEALLDFIVVSYEYDSRLYQGVLLDTSKRSIPCGILSPAGFPGSFVTQHGSGTEEDKMHSVSQRFTYFQDKTPLPAPAPVGVAGKDGLPPGSAYHMRRAMRGGQSKFSKSSRMTVRLRPRQVLCSKCKSICNENSENVDLSKKRKGEESSVPPGVQMDKRHCPSRQIAPKSPRPPFAENPQDYKLTGNSVSSAAAGRKKSNSPTVISTSLIPRSVEETELNNGVGSNVNKIKIVGGFWTQDSSDELKTNSDQSKRTTRVKSSARGESRSSTVVTESVIVGNSLNDDSFTGNNEAETKTNVISSSNEMSEGLESMHEPKSEAQSETMDTSSSKLNSSVTSSENDENQERMVLRKKRNVGSMEDLWDESVFLEDTTRRTTPVIKISFGTQGEGTVLKIPSKVRSYHASESEVEEVDVSQNEVPAKAAGTKAAKRALKRAKKEARRKMVGATSPARSIGSSSPAYETSLYHRRRKRKVKHKKKHKEVRVKHGVDSVEGVSLETHSKADVGIPSVFLEDPLHVGGNPPPADMGLVDDCGNNYNSMKERCLKQKLSISLKRLNATAYARCGDSSSSAGSDSPGSGSNSELYGADELPDFPGPPPTHALVTVGSCLTGDGRTMEVGDVVWGKIHGFPWWPGKVLSITVTKKDDGAAVAPQAHVAWYGSSTSSLMPCDQLSPFLETFKTRYNKKKRGPYKEAIRQATCEARKDSHDPLQEIDVVS